MLQWMNKEGIAHLYDVFKEHHINPRALIAIRALLVPPKENFFTMLKEELAIKVGDMLQLYTALSKLPV